MRYFMAPEACNQNDSRSVSVVDGQIDSVALFDKVREIIILHMGNKYKLRITSNEKLILTK